MGTGSKIFGFFLTLILFVISIHLVFHIFVYGTGIPGIAEEGISGIAIGDVNLREELSRLSPRNIDKTVSTWILIIEWSVLILLGIIFIVRQKVLEGREFVSADLKKKSVKTTSTTTDLDSLYEILKEKKHLKLSTIAKLYGVDEKVVMSWGKIFESGSLVKIEYPFFGEPRFVYVEKDINIPDSTDKTDKHKDKKAVIDNEKEDKKKRGKK